jgi:hypothetical protein
MNPKTLRGLASVLALCCIAEAYSVTPQRAVNRSPSVATPAPVMVTGAISNISLTSGTIVVAGRSYLFSAQEVAFSDDRKQPPEGGFKSLASGVKVTLRATYRQGSWRVVQLVARD